MTISKTTAAAITAALTLSPKEAVSQDTFNREIAVKEFKMIDKDESYKLSTIEYLDFVAAQSLNPVDMKNKVNAALMKFNHADKNRDGELNIDEYSALKQNKTPITTIHQAANKPQTDKAKSEKEAFEILKPFFTFQNANYRLFENGDRRRNDINNAMKSLKKIDYSNVAEVILLKNDKKNLSDNRGIAAIINLLETACLGNEKMIDMEMNRFYNLLEQRAADSNCANRFKRQKEQFTDWGTNRVDMLTGLAKVVIEGEEH